MLCGVESDNDPGATLGVTAFLAVCILTSNTYEVAVGEAIVIPLCILSISKVALGGLVVYIVVCAKIVVKSELGNVNVTNNGVTVNVLNSFSIELMIFLLKLNGVGEGLGNVLTIILILVYKLYKILVLAAGSILSIVCNGNFEVLVCISLGNGNGIIRLLAAYAATGEYELAGGFVVLAGPVGVVMTDGFDNLFNRTNNEVALGATNYVIVRAGNGVGRRNCILRLYLTGLVSKKLICNCISLKLSIAGLAIHNLIMRSAHSAGRSNLILINRSKRSVSKSRNFLMTEGGTALGAYLMAKSVFGTGSFLGNLPSIACMFTGCRASHVN